MATYGPSHSGNIPKANYNIHCNIDKKVYDKLHGYLEKLLSELNNCPRIDLFAIDFPHQRALKDSLYKKATKIHKKINGLDRVTPTRRSNLFRVACAIQNNIEGSRPDASPVPASPEAVKHRINRIGEYTLYLINEIKKDNSYDDEYDVADMFPELVDVDGPLSQSYLTPPHSSHSSQPSSRGSNTSANDPSTSSSGSRLSQMGSMARAELSQMKSKARASMGKGMRRVRNVFSRMDEQSPGFDSARLQGNVYRSTPLVTCPDTSLGDEAGRANTTLDSEDYNEYISDDEDWEN